MIKIAVPNKGALSDESVNLLKEAGYRCKRSSRELSVIDPEHDLEFVFLRPRDIAIYVGTGIIEIGITGRDLAIDSQAKVEELMPLQFGFSKFCYAVPVESDLTPDRFQNVRIATSYPHIVQQNLAHHNIQAQIVRLDGAVEISIQLGVADVIADVVESGLTLKEAGLKIVGEPVIQSEAILIAHNMEMTKNPQVRVLLDRIRGILVARNYAMIEYDIPKIALQQACLVTPGIQSPTISPLANPDWISVKSMLERKRINASMDQLKVLGAKGIIATDIRSCRL